MTHYQKKRGHGFVQESVRNACTKFKVDRLSCFRTGARHVLTTKKRFTSEIPLTMKIATSNKKDRRRMETCKADNIAEKLFRSYWKQGKSPLYKKCYKSLSINSCSVDVSAIKNALLKHQEIYSKIPAVDVVHIVILELHPQFHFLRFFLLGTPIFRNTEELFFFLTASFQARIYSLYFYFFPQKIRRPVLFSTSSFRQPIKLLLLMV